jgi:hypothetical protein
VARRIAVNGSPKLPYPFLTMCLLFFPRLRLVLSLAALSGAVASSVSLNAQPGGLQGGPGVFGGRGGPGGEQMRIVAQFDRDGDQRLNVDERKEARAWLESRAVQGPFGGRANLGPAEPGARLTPADVKTFPNVPVYEMTALRTFFLEFENADWEAELAAFYNTDVEVPATLTVDGRVFSDVGVRFRGNTSYFGVPAGRKRPLNLSLDAVHENQQLGGYRTFNLLNASEDPSFLRSVLYHHIAREYLPAPKATFARVVINGESWGVYPSVQQFNKDFARDWYGTPSGARWKAPPQGRGGLQYLGDDPALYKRAYEIKSKDDPASWTALVDLARVLGTTPPDRLEAALAPILDVDETLRFLAVDVALVNGDGYWARGSDFSLFRDPKGRFHIIPYDANETFNEGRGGGPGRGRGGRFRGAFPPDVGFGPPPVGFDLQRGRPGGPGGFFMMGGSIDLDPLVGLDDETKPLRSKLLSVPALRERYLGYVRDIATRWLDWQRLGPIAEGYHALIAADVKADTKKLDTYEAFEAGLQTLKSFAERRRAVLLK